ncbi:Mitochondrial inner membrane protein oxa1 [Mortierella sp. NVP41]|nr:Mitochondrial inner membrane protein oxa1 [Mortierella sp. NVP41]
MSDHTQELHDPTVDTLLEEPLEDGDNASSGILLEKADYDHSSPEFTSLNSSTILDHPEDDSKVEHGDKDKAKSSHLSPTKHAAPAVVSNTPVARPITGAVPVKPVSPAVPLSTSTALSTEVVDLNQTMPWKLFYPLISRETIISLCKGTAINFFLPFVNGVFLGFGEICAHELAYRWGWTNSAHVVNVPGRRPVGGEIGIRAAGASGAGSSGYAGSRSGIGGLGPYENDFDLNKTTSTF